MSSPVTESGGFLQPTMLSPAPTSVASSVTHSTLPTPRRQPLKSGSNKETALINYVDKGLAQINRRYAYKDTTKSTQAREDASAIVGSSAVKGYRSFRDVANDLERLMDIVWVSGTPSLQIPYLLSFASLVVNFLPSFPASPRSMFSILHKLDVAFASLIQGQDLDTYEPLPGIQGGGKGVTSTEKVRIKSLVEHTRVTVVRLMAKTEFDEGADDGGSDPDESVLTMDVDHEDDHDMDVARVYDRTLVELGDSLSGPSIGIPNA